MKKTKIILTLVLLTFGLNLQAQEGATEVKPQPVYKAPNGKAFPANWGAPPLRLTRDLRVLPGGYGRGSGTLARWIQENLDKDAEKNKPGIKPVVAKKAYPKHWGAPPRLQTKDLRPLPGGYGLGSSTLAGWIQKNLTNDAKNGVPAPPVLIPGIVAPPDPVAPTFDPAAEANKNAKADLAKVQVGIKAWEATKAKCKGNYSYKIGFQSWVLLRQKKILERYGNVYLSFQKTIPGVAFLNTLISIQLVVLGIYCFTSRSIHLRSKKFLRCLIPLV